MDTVDALYYAIPKDVRRDYLRALGRRRLLPHERIRAVKDMLHEIDLMRATQNLAIEHVIDYIGGQVGKRSKKLSQRLGAPVGIQTMLNRGSQLLGY